MAGVAFQFHKGTIRTKDFKKMCSLAKSFQFHKGTIRTIEAEKAADTANAFQFHKGTIRTSLLSTRQHFFTPISIP